MSAAQAQIDIIAASEQGSRQNAQRAPPWPSPRERSFTSPRPALATRQLLSRLQLSAEQSSGGPRALQVVPLGRAPRPESLLAILLPAPLSCSALASSDYHSLRPPLARSPTSTRCAPSPSRPILAVGDWLTPPSLGIDAPPRRAWHSSLSPSLLDLVLQAHTARTMGLKKVEDRPTPSAVYNLCVARPDPGPLAPLEGAPPSSRFAALC